MSLKTVLKMLSAITSDADLAKMFEDTPDENICVIGVGNNHTGAMISNRMEPEAALEAAEPLLRYAISKFTECNCDRCRKSAKRLNVTMFSLGEVLTARKPTTH